MKNSVWTLAYFEWRAAAQTSRVHMNTTIGRNRGFRNKILFARLVHALVWHINLAACVTIQKVELRMTLVIHATSIHMQAVPDELQHAAVIVKPSEIMPPAQSQSPFMSPSLLSCRPPAILSQPLLQANARAIALDSIDEQSSCITRPMLESHDLGARSWHSGCLHISAGPSNRSYHQSLHGLIWLRHVSYEWVNGHESKIEYLQVFFVKTSDPSLGATRHPNTTSSGEAIGAILGREDSSIGIDMRRQAEARESRDLVHRRSATRRLGV